ncbi:hypothetical protein CSC18_3260 [Klebsiella aerogenes]|nr:hypothetical protein CSC18_3260 [Klebsiella aerogenes]
MPPVAFRRALQAAKKNGSLMGAVAVSDARYFYSAVARTGGAEW